MALKPNLTTIRSKIEIARCFEDSLTGSSANTYLGIARPVDWSLGIPPQPIETTDSINEVFRNLVALKKITASDINLVIPRVDWASGTRYTPYTANLELYTTSSTTALAGTSNTTSVNGSANSLFGDSSTNYTASLAVGDKILLLGTGSSAAPLVVKEVISFTNNKFLTVNSAFAYSYTGNTVYKVVENSIQYANKFYIRNTRDQVFKCLLNTNNSTSTVMPEINIDGSLPESAYISTSDGYKWKYMYTIPSGMKEKFFTSEWMPVVSETNVTNAAIDGRLSIFKIISGGTGYQGGASSASATIVSVVGDGSSANLTATVSSGIVTGINILNPGSGYTTATLSFVDPSKLAGASANVLAIIEPQNGNGFDPYYELGAKSIMVSVDLSGSENSTIPTTNESDIFDYRQISIVKNPKSTANEYLSGSNYNTTSIITVVPTASTFRLDETVFQGTTLPTASYSATVVNWDSDNNQIWVNNQVGTFSPSQPIRGTVQTSSITTLSITEPEYNIFTGEILYIENREPILRSSSQTEQIKLVLTF